VAPSMPPDKGFPNFQREGGTSICAKKSSRGPPGALPMSRW